MVIKFPVTINEDGSMVVNPVEGLGELSNFAARRGKDMNLILLVVLGYLGYELLKGRPGEVSRWVGEGGSVAPVPAPPVVPSPTTVAETSTVTSNVIAPASANFWNEFVGATKVNILNTIGSFSTSLGVALKASPLITIGVGETKYFAIEPNIAAVVSSMYLVVIRNILEVRDANRGTTLQNRVLEIDANGNLIRISQVSLPSAGVSSTVLKGYSAAKYTGGVKYLLEVRNLGPNTAGMEVMWHPGSPIGPTPTPYRD